MNRKIVCVESPDFMIEALRAIATTEQDEVYLLTSDEKRLGGPQVYHVDVRKDYDEAKQIISMKIGQPAAILTSQEMFLTQTATLARDFGVSTNSVEAVQIARDKSQMKEVWVKQGIRTPKGSYYQSPKQIHEGVGGLTYPLIIKPSSGYASCGVKKVKDEQELREQLRKVFLINSTVVAKEKLSNIGFLLEEYLDGEEYSIDTIWFNGEPVCSGILCKGNASGPYFPDRLYYHDPSLAPEIQKEIAELSYAAVQAIGLQNGATHTEIRFREGKPYVLETTGRPGAGGIFYELLKGALGIDFNVAYYASLVSRDEALLAQIREQAKRPPATEDQYFWYNIPHEGCGVIKEIHGLDELRACEEIQKVLCYKKPGATLYQDDLNSDYFCSVVGRFSSSRGENIWNFVEHYDQTLRLVYL